MKSTRLACSRLDSRYNISLFDSNHFFIGGRFLRTKLARKIPPRCACSISANSTKRAGHSSWMCLFNYAAGPTIVHEWGHLRWGLKDEYPVTGRDSFYHDAAGEVTAVKCGKHMVGDHVDSVTGGQCDINSTTGLPTSTCRFRPNPAQEVEASLMFYHNITEVSVSVTCFSTTT